MTMARLAPRHRSPWCSSQLDDDDEGEDELFRSQTWFGAGDPDAPAPLEALGLGLAAKTLLTPNAASATTRITPANRALTPRLRGGGAGGGAFIAPSRYSMRQSAVSTN